MEDPGVDTFTYFCMFAYLLVCHEIFLCVRHMLNWLQCKKPSKLPGEKTVRHDAFLLVQLLIWKTAMNSLEIVVRLS